MCDVGSVVLLHPLICGSFLGNVHLHGLIKFPKHKSISRLIFNSSNVWEFVAYTIFFMCPIDKNANPQTLEEFKVSIRCKIDCISEIQSMRVNAHFLKRSQKRVDEGGNFLHLTL